MGFLLWWVDMGFLSSLSIRALSLSAVAGARQKLVGPFLIRPASVVHAGSAIH